MKIIITGATGMVGAEVVRQAILDTAIQEITAIVRKPLDVQHPKLKTVVHQDFLDYTSLAGVFKENNACLWCLGISQSQVSKEEYHTITYEYAMAAAKAMLQANPSISFVFLSGMGADSTEKSKTTFARVKGKTENALQKLEFKKLHIVRPGGIKPVHKNKNAPWTNKVMIPLFPLFEFIIPSSVISSVELAKVMLYIAKQGYDKKLMENRELKKIYKEHFV